MHTDKQTNKQINAGKNIYLLAEVNKTKILLMRHHPKPNQDPAERTYGSVLFHMPFPRKPWILYRYDYHTFE